MKQLKEQAPVSDQEVIYKSAMRPLYKMVGELNLDNFLTQTKKNYSVRINIFGSEIQIESDSVTVIDYFTSLFPQYLYSKPPKRIYQYHIITKSLPFGGLATFVDNKLSIFFKTHAKNSATTDNQSGYLVFTKYLSNGRVSSDLYGQFSIASIFKDWNSILAESTPLDVWTLGIVEYRMIELVSQSLYNCIILHSCAVKSANGAILFPASTLSGKTTLALALVNRGFRLLSDEAICFDLEKSLLFPLVRRMTVRNGSCELLPSLKLRQQGKRMERGDETIYCVDTERVFGQDGVSISDGALPKTVIFLEGFGKDPNLVSLKHSDAVLRLIRHNLVRVQNPQKTFFALCREFANLECFTLTVGHPLDTADYLFQFFGGNLV